MFDYIRNRKKSNAENRQFCYVQNRAFQLSLNLEHQTYWTYEVQILRLRSTTYRLSLTFNTYRISLGSQKRRHRIFLMFETDNAEQTKRFDAF